MTNPVDIPVIILGAGPAGLTAGYELSARGVSSIVLEQDSVVGGLARTVEYRGYLFDIGGHRFYTKVNAIEKIWRDILGEDLKVRSRLSRIFYNGCFFSYPLDPLEVIRGLGVLEVARCGLSFAKAQLWPTLPEEDFETWVSNKFGRRLFETFFRAYTEKVWGVSCSEIRAEWAAQRIRGLNLGSLIRNSMFRPKRENAIKTLIREFLYPRRGPGMMWSRMRDILESRGTRVLLNTPVESVDLHERGVCTIRAGGRSYRAEHVISSIPIQNLMPILKPSAPQGSLDSASNLRYRDFMVAALIVKRSNLFPDNWIYIHDPAVSVGRIQNYANWSPEMTPDPAMTGLGLEYFCQEGDRLWNMCDQDVLALARSELAHLKLVDSADVADGTVIRARKAYPVYDANYRSHLIEVRKHLDPIPNLQLIGRNGMHRYNNQDHSMLTGIFAARNVLGASYDLWDLNLDSGYLEEGAAFTEEDLQSLESTQPWTPNAVSAR